MLRNLITPGIIYCFMKPPTSIVGVNIRGKIDWNHICIVVHTSYQTDNENKVAITAGTKRLVLQSGMKLQNASNINLDLIHVCDLCSKCIWYLMLLFGQTEIVL